MGYLVSLFSLSEEATSTALDISEVVLCVSGLLLLFGAVGEYLSDHNRLPRWMNWPKVLFEIIVAISLGGELLADGGVAILSHRLQKLEGFDIQALDRKTQSATDKAADALGKSSTAASKALSAEDASVRAQDKSGKAEKVASGAMTLARGARSELASVNKDVEAAQKRVAAIHAYLTPRSLTPKEMDDLRDAFKPIADSTIPILVIGSWDSGLGVQVWRSLKDAGFGKADLREEYNLPYGSSMATPPKYAGVADKIGDILLKAGIGPMIGLTGLLPDTDPIRILIGDVRTAPLPPLAGKTAR